VKGIGLIGKNPDIDFRRGNFLSRDIGYLKNRVIISRMISKLILTSSGRSNNITKD